MTKEQMKSEIREMEKWLYPCRIYFGEHVKEEDAMGYFQDEQDGLWKGYEYMERGMGGIGYVFPTEEEANAFVPPEWFTEDVTMSGEYQNSKLACGR